MTVSAHIKDVFAVMASRAAGQAVLLASTLYVTPFIGPREFGFVGLFTATASIVCQVTSGRAEAVGLAARSPRGGRFFIGLAYVFNFAAFVVLMALALGAQVFVATPELRFAILLFPVAVLLQSLNQYVLPAQITHQGRNKLAGRQVGIAAAVTAAGQVLAAHILPTSGALIFARAGGQAVGSFSALQFLRTGVAQARALVANWSWRRIRPVYRELFLSAPSAILTVLAFQVPVYFFAMFGLVEQIGLFWLGFNLLFTPYLVISASIRPIFLRNVSRVVYGPELIPTLRRASILGAVLGGGLAFCVAAVAWVFIGQLLPPEWLTAREFTVALAIMIVGLSAALPFNAAVPALRSQRPNFVMNLIQLGARAGVLFAALWAGWGPAHGLFAMAVVSLIISLGYVVIMLDHLNRRAVTRAKAGS